MERVEDYAPSHACLDEFDERYSETSDFNAKLAKLWSKALVKIKKQAKREGKKMVDVIPTDLQLLLGDFAVRNADANCFDVALEKVEVGTKVLAFIAAVRKDAKAAKIKAEEEASKAKEAKIKASGRRGLDCCYSCRGPVHTYDLEYPVGEDDTMQTFCAYCYDDVDEAGAYYGEISEDDEYNSDDDEDGFYDDEDEYGMGW